MRYCRVSPHDPQNPHLSLHLCTTTFMLCSTIRYSGVINWPRLQPAIRAYHPIDEGLGMVPSRNYTVLRTISVLRMEFHWHMVSSRESALFGVKASQLVRNVSSVSLHNLHLSLIAKTGRWRSVVRFFLGLQCPMWNLVNWHRIFLIRGMQVLDLFRSKWVTTYPLG